MKTALPGINFQVFENYEDLSVAAASFMYQAVAEKPNLLFCAASGSSPRRAYDLWADQLKLEKATHQIRLIALDEWEGIGIDNPFSSGYQINNQLIKPLSLQNYFLFNGLYANAIEEIQRAEQFLSQQGTIDLCVLGIGTNGHLGFNEPGDFLSPLPHKSRLTAESQAHPMINGAAFQPKYGITLGLRDILLSKKILLLVNGTHKKDIMAQWLKQELNTQLPASLLWLHPNLTCFCDKEAALVDLFNNG